MEIDQVSTVLLPRGTSRLALLTNGAEWRAYHFYRPQADWGNLPFEQRQLFQVQLGGDEETVRSRNKCGNYP